MNSPDVNQTIPASVPPGQPGATGVTSSALIERVKNMILTPKTEWPVVEREPTSIGQLYTSYVAPLALFAAVLAFIHVSIIGIHIPFGGGTLRQPFMTGVVSLIMTLVGAFIGLFVVGFVINVLAPTFGGVRDLRQAVKTAAYAFTPAWASAVFGLLPAFGTLLQLAADCYAIYVLYLGLPIVMRGKRESAAGYTASVVVCTIILGFIIGAVMAGVGIAGGTFAHFGQSSEVRQAQERDEAAATMGNVLGNMLGTDAKGKQDIGSAMAKLAAAGDNASKNGGSSAADAGAAGTAAAGQTVNGTASASGTASTNSDAAAQDSAAKAVAATGGLIAALGGALGGEHRVTPVDFQVLKGMLPAALPGMERTNASGEAKQGLGMKSTNATGTYKGGGATVAIEIADASAVSGLMDMAESLPQTTASESDSGYEKDVILGGRKVHEKYDTHSRHGELQTIVGKRFTVGLSGDGIDMSQLESSFGSIDLGKLESMKNANPQ